MSVALTGRLSPVYGALSQEGIKKKNKEGWKVWNLLACSSFLLLSCWSCIDSQCASSHWNRIRYSNQRKWIEPEMIKQRRSEKRILCVRLVPPRVLCSPRELKKSPLSGTKAKQQKAVFFKFVSFQGCYCDSSTTRDLSMRVASLAKSLSLRGGSLHNR